MALKLIGALVVAGLIALGVHAFTKLIQSPNRKGKKR